MAHGDNSTLGLTASFSLFDISDSLRQCASSTPIASSQRIPSTFSLIRNQPRPGLPNWACGTFDPLYCEEKRAELAWLLPQGAGHHKQARPNVPVFGWRPTWPVADRLTRSPSCFCEMLRSLVAVRRFGIRILVSGRRGPGPRSPRSYVHMPRACSDLDCSQETRSPLSVPIGRGSTGP